MSENAAKEGVSGRALSQAVIAEMLGKNFERLPDVDRKLFLYGPLYLGGNAGLAGLVANSLYRRALHVAQAPIASGLPMVVLPFLTTAALYNATVCAPLLSGDLSCPSCVAMRGALVGLVGAAVYPTLLAMPVNVGLARRYNTTPMPVKGNMLRYVVDVSRPIARRMMAVAVLQVLFGTYLGSRHFEAYAKLAQITFGPGEVLKD